jgi:hypothetical protein
MTWLRSCAREVKNEEAAKLDSQPQDKLRAARR